MIAFVLVVSVGTAAFLLEGWALTLLWAWYIVPLGAPALSIPAAIGVALTVGMVTHQHPGNTEDVDWADITGRAVFGPLFILGIGWIVRHFL